MSILRISWLMVVAAAAPAVAWEPMERGSWVALQVEVGGRAAPLYASADGNRYYVEARQGRDYALRLENRTGERVAVEINVDGLNVISGERDTAAPDRMYVLDPWERTEIRGWRTSLDEVRRFTFVDEQASYAARSDKANGKMGWIEMAVYRARTRHRRQVTEEKQQRHKRDRRPATEPPATEPPAAADAEAPRGAMEESHRGETADAARPSVGGAGRKSYPGTGWGDATEDRVRLVDFHAESVPVERLTVRYEYRDALYALGVLPGRRSRLEERERGEYGFAQPPRR